MGGKKTLWALPMCGGRPMAGAKAKQLISEVQPDGSVIFRNDQGLEWKAIEDDVVTNILVWADDCRFSSFIAMKKPSEISKGDVLDLNSISAAAFRRATEAADGFDEDCGHEESLRSIIESLRRIEDKLGALPEESAGPYIEMSPNDPCAGDVVEFRLAGLPIDEPVGWQVIAPYKTMLSSSINIGSAKETQSGWRKVFEAGEYTIAAVWVVLVRHSVTHTFVVKER